MDLRTGVPKPYIEFYPARLSVNKINVETVFLESGKVVKIPPRENTIPYLVSDDYDVTVDYHSINDGPTERAPLGAIVLARSGVSPCFTEKYFS